MTAFVFVFVCFSILLLFKYYQFLFVRSFANSQRSSSMPSPDDLDFYVDEFSLPRRPENLYCMTTYLNGYLKCQAPSAQLSSLYRSARFSDDCDAIWARFTTCRRLLTMPPEEALEYLTRTRAAADEAKQRMWPKRTTPPSDFGPPADA